MCDRVIARGMLPLYASLCCIGSGVARTTRPGTMNQRVYRKSCVHLSKMAVSGEMYLNRNKIIITNIIYAF